MAIFTYLADRTGGSLHQWTDTVVKGRVQAARGIRNDGRGNVSGYVEGEGWVKITRVVEIKAHPSRHECDDRCLNATGRTMKCECSCGGKNHGRGSIVCEEAA